MGTQLTRAQRTALDALVDTIVDPATPAIVLAIDVPFKAVLLGVSWRRLCVLFAERRARQRRTRHPTRPRARRRR